MKLLEAFVKNISFPLLAKRYGTPKLFKYLERLEDSQYWDVQDIREFQLAKMKELLCHAYVNCVFYQDRFDQAGFNPFEFRDLSEIGNLPLLDKIDIRKNVSTLTAKNFSAKELHFSETGGTTGVKMKFFRDNGCLAPKEAALFRFEKWAGWDFGQRVGIVWPAKQDYVGHWSVKAKIKNEIFRREVVLPAAVLDEELIWGYLDSLRKKRPATIRAFTSPLYEIARYMIENYIEDISVNGVITAGEPVYEHQRQTIEKAFHCSVFDSYRTREAGTVAQECENHNGLHINAESLYLEILADEASGGQSGKSGEVVITDLLNYGMPLIRYKMGDIATLSAERCPCGRGLPLIHHIQGRVSQTFYTPDGKKLSSGSLVLYLVDEAPGYLGQVQIIQERIDHLIIRMTGDPAPSDELKNYQIRKVRELFGPAMKVTFETVDKIDREESGKYMFAISRIGDSNR